MSRLGLISLIVVVMTYGVARLLFSTVRTSERQYLSIAHMHATRYMGSDDSYLRILPNTGSQTLYADWVMNSSRGSLWLPRPPPTQLISGYEFKTSGNEFHKEYYRGNSGFMHEDYADTVMSQTYNAGDFLASYIVPAIAGRPMNIPSNQSTNRCSIKVVGSILQWGIRYSWGPGFIDMTDKTHGFTEAVFATRGPVSYKQAVSTAEPDAKISEVFGDVGSLLAWYYQPFDQEKTFTLCVIPHYVDAANAFITALKESWKDLHVIAIADPLFSIMDQIVKCKFVLSSSLHGLIFSDSYNIPNAHLHMSTWVTGGYHKFDDYFESVKRTRKTFDTWEIQNRTGALPSSEEVAAFVQESTASYDPSNINVLPFWSNCPMHAEAYDRTREEHMQFVRKFANDFVEALDNRPGSFLEFHAQVGGLVLNVRE